MAEKRPTESWSFGETGVFRERRGDAHMTGPRSAEVTTVSHPNSEERLMVGWHDLVCWSSGEARRSAPGVSRAHPLLRSAGASLTALGGAFARQPHPAFFSHPPAPAWSAQAADVTCTHSPVAGSAARRPAARGWSCKWRQLFESLFLKSGIYGKNSRFGPQPRRSRAARAPTAKLPRQRNDRRKVWCCGRPTAVPSH